MSEKVLIAGVGMIPFAKPGASLTYTEMGAEATRRALADAGLGYEQVQEAYVGYVYGDSTCGQTALYEVGLTGIPIVNVNNNCSTGSTALYLARKAITSGDADCALALGFEQMQAGALKSHWSDRPVTRERFMPVLRGLTQDMGDMPQAVRTFAGAGREHMQRYGTSMETFAAVRAKASRHAANNPLALFRKILTTEDVMADT
ncbi:MAG: lipid-transfer protein, partial [Burkholderiales bacterium]|nr:lipid-transfer protein [Burkholderiales bacterium]